MTEGGFTLLEVLVALVLLGMVLTMVTNAESDGLSRAGRIEMSVRAASLANAVLAQLGVDKPLRPGTFHGASPPLAWSLKIERAASNSAGPPLAEIDLTITAPAGRVIGTWRTLRLANQPPAP